VEIITRVLVLTNDQLEEVESLLMNSFNEGLRKETNPIAPVKMFPTFVRDVPDGKDKYGLKFKMFINVYQCLSMFDVFEIVNYKIVKL